MKLSCLPVSFFSEIIEQQMSVGEWASMGASLNFDAIDLSMLFVSDRSTSGLENMRRSIESVDMQLAMVTTYPDFTHPDPDQRQVELSIEQEAVRVAAALGAELVRVTAGRPTWKPDVNRYTVGCSGAFPTG